MRWSISSRTAKVLRITGAVVVIGGTAALWRLTGLGEGDELAQEARPFLRWDWAPALVLLVYVVGAGLAFFPILPLIIATGFLMPGWEAFGYALGGSLLAALAGYWVGRKVGADVLEQVAGKSFRSLCDTLPAAGVMGVAAIRLFPAAPYTVIGLVAGAVRVGLVPYLFGTLIGLLPGVLIFSFLGRQLRSGEQLWLTGLTLLAATALGLGGWWKVRRDQRRKERGAQDQPREARVS